MAKIDIRSHDFVPKHTVLTKEETEKVLKSYNITAAQLPKIFVNDPVLKIIKAEVGDIIKIERVSPTAEISYAYRVVVDIR
jgi:DNA-directed RNA polymerase subunit H